MKIVLCAQTDDASSQTDSRFGRAAFFALFDDETRQWQFLPNQQNLQAAQGAGIQSAQTVLDAGAEVLLAANVGPKAMAALTTGGVKVFTVGANLSLEEAVEAYTDGKLTQIQQANVQGHWM